VLRSGAAGFLTWGFAPFALSAMRILFCSDANALRLPLLDVFCSWVTSRLSQLGKSSANTLRNIGFKLLEEPNSQSATWFRRARYRPSPVAG
jgi:hypothetical protein